MVGGRNYRKSQFNLAVQGERQPGSSFKPFVLATALKQGHLAGDDVRLEAGVDLAGGRLWDVHNYEDSYLGPIDLRRRRSTPTTPSSRSSRSSSGPARRRARRSSLGITSPLSLLLDRPRRRGGEPARDGARVLGVRERRLPHRRRVVRQPAARDRLGRRTRTGGWSTTTSRSAPGADARTRPRSSTRSCRRSSPAAPAGGALSDGRPVAGKTGTTENYGDAWFVGYTPQLVAAVWVGYPNELRPMLTEFHGDPVAGGTFPALIWKSFMEKALAYLHDEPADVPAAVGPVRGAEARRPARTGSSSATTATAAARSSSLYFAGRGPRAHGGLQAERGRGAARRRRHGRRRERALAAQPLTPLFVYRPARPASGSASCSGRTRRAGTLSATTGDARAPKPLHGVVPKRRRPDGSTRAQATLERLKLEAADRRQSPPGRGRLPRAHGRAVAAAPGLDGQADREDSGRLRKREPARRSARALGRPRDPDPRAGDDFDSSRSVAQLERRLVERRGRRARA